MTAPETRRGIAQRSVVQIGVFVVSLLMVVWGVAGMIANPSFATGAQATSRMVLGVDFNGWHALSAIALFIPGLVAARDRQWATLFAMVTGAGMGVTGVWALFDPRPYGGLLLFTEPVSDAILHFAVTLALGGALILDKRQEPRAQRG